MLAGDRKGVHDAVGKLSSGLVVAPDVKDAWSIVRSADASERMW